MSLRVFVPLLLLAASFASAEASKERARALSSIERYLGFGATPKRLEHFRPQIEAEIAAFPEMLPLLYRDAHFRAWYGLGRLLDHPVKDLEASSKLLGGEARLFTRLLAALQFAHAGREPEMFVEFALAALARTKFERSWLYLEDHSNLEFADVEALLEILLRILDGLPGDTTTLREGLRALPNLPVGLERTSFGANYEILRLGILLGPAVHDEDELIRRLAPFVLDRRTPRNVKLAAARGLRRLRIAHPTVVELEQVLKWQHEMNRPRRRWWSRAPVEPPEFFTDREGLAGDLFRLWRSRDADFIDYLLASAEGRGRGDLSPAHVADALADLELQDERFLPFFRANLNKIGAKNMPLFFRNFVRLWPERAPDVVAALFVVRSVRELFTPYLTDLVTETERQPKILETLRSALDRGLVRPDRQVAIDDLRLDDWLEREVDRRRCARALDSDPNLKDEHVQK